MCSYSVAANVRLAYPTSYSKLPDDELERWTGFIRHSHIQSNKVGRDNGGSGGDTEAEQEPEHHRGQMATRAALFMCEAPLRLLV